MFGNIAIGSNRENSITFDTKRVIGSSPKNRIITVYSNRIKKKRYFDRNLDVVII